ncbi:hypothetical protein GCM10010401_08840 [Rarobacter faecitabidus]|uniref:Uncharacterized protein n=1 Tax=Rarobacter faecitabidus TaxID=13243 RepID=A0A542ZAX7_RARFA|nr:hypothetical protein [Rarobacter faecitabidus]TQL57485.1 hypothetical protein FB461_2222 [Rarobacter faecitabidus]
MTIEIDLFDFVPEIAAERHEARNRPLRAAVECLRDSIPEALELVLYLENRSGRDSRAPRSSGNWAYAVGDAGLRHESWEHWARPTDGGKSGWNRTPKNLTTWAQLRDVLGDDPRRNDLTEWADSLPEPKWKDLYRPHELWPHPETWHPSYIEGDRSRPGWAQRITAWRTCQVMLSDAMEALT